MLYYALACILNNIHSIKGNYKENILKYICVLYSLTPHQGHILGLGSSA